MKNIKIPQGEEVVIYYKNKNNAKVNIFRDSKSTVVLDGDITLPFNSSYSQFLDASSSPVGKIVRAVSSSKGLPFGGFKELGFYQWDKTEPLSLNFSCTVVGTGQAKTQVVAPVMKLLQSTLPAESNLPFGLPGKGLVPPGYSLSQAFNRSANPEQVLKGMTRNITSFDLPGGIGDVLGQVSGLLEQGLSLVFDTSDSRGILFTVELGGLVIHELNLIKVNPTFSAKRDSTGCPISAKVEFQFQSIFTPTTEYINAIMKNSGIL